VDRPDGGGEGEGEVAGEGKTRRAPLDWRRTAVDVSMGKGSIGISRGCLLSGLEEGVGIIALCKKKEI
jgi:hypothetical protein